MHVTQLVDVADVHLLLVDLRLVEILQRNKKRRSTYALCSFTCSAPWSRSYQEVNGAADLLILRLVSLHAVPEEKKKPIRFRLNLTARGVC